MADPAEGRANGRISIRTIWMPWRGGGNSELAGCFEPYFKDEEFRIGCVSLLSGELTKELVKHEFGGNVFRFEGYKDQNQQDAVVELVKATMRYAEDQGLAIVVFPELTVFPPALEAISSFLRDRADHTLPPHLVVAGSRHRPLVDGAAFDDPTTEFINEAVIFDGFGEEVYSHEKFARFYYKRIEDGEKFIEAVRQRIPDSLTVLDLGIAHAVTLICKDFLVEGLEWLRKAGVDLWLVPAMTRDVGAFAGLAWARGSLNQGIVAVANTCSLWGKDPSDFDGRHRQTGFVYFPERFPDPGLHFYGCADDATCACGRCCVGFLTVGDAVSLTHKII
jgi:predicted amidohydrolase